MIWDIGCRESRSLLVDRKSSRDFFKRSGQVNRKRLGKSSEILAEPLRDSGASIGCAD